MSLTPLCLAFAALVALAGIAHQWSEAAFPWWRWGAAVVVLGLIYEWWRVRRCRLTAAVAGHRLRLGRRDELTLVLQNGERRPLAVQFTPYLPAGIATTDDTRATVVPALAENRQAIPVRAVKLGNQPWRKLPVRIRGPLGLAWWSKPRPLDAELVVVPDILDRGPASAGSAPAGVSRRSLAGTGQELSHLRSYQPGDPRHTIDWKATARTSALVTRVMREDQHLSIMLVVDAGRTSRTRIDGMSQLGHYANVCARFAERAVASGDQVGLVTVASRPLAVLAPARGVAAVARIRAALAGLSTEAAETDLVAAALAVRNAVRRRCLILLLTDLYGQSGSGRLMQSIRLWVPKHLPVVAGLIAEETERLATAEAREWLDPYVALAAADYRRDLETAASGLRRLGAYPLIARASSLEAQVLEQYRLLKTERRI